MRSLTTYCFILLSLLSYSFVQGQSDGIKVEIKDIKFGVVFKGTQICKLVEIKNTGKIPILIRDVNIEGTTEFSTSIYFKLPIIINPGQNYIGRFCYLPTDEGNDTATITWDIQHADSVNIQFHQTSLLIGTGVTVGIRWDRDSLVFEADTVETIKRVYLVNIARIPVELARIEIWGLDKDEFRIVGTQYDYAKSPYDGLVIDTGNNLWIDIGFKANLISKTPIFRPRFAQLIAYPKLDSSTISILELLAVFQPALVTSTTKPNIKLSYSTFDGNIRLDFEQGVVAGIKIFEMFGRLILEEDNGLARGKANTLSTQAVGVKGHILFK